MAASWFSDVQVAPAIEVFALSNAYKQDPNPDKVNLGVGGKFESDVNILRGVLTSQISIKNIPGSLAMTCEAS
jgi:aspartate/tyrosine/aromatic aminotransferase